MDKPFAGMPSRRTLLKGGAVATALVAAPSVLRA